MKIKTLVLLLFLLTLDAEAGLRKLKQSTATTVNVHLVNATTGVGMTGQTIASITGFIAKHKDTTSVIKTTVTFAGSEVGQGLYNINLTAAHTDTLGDLTLCYGFSGAVETCDTYEVSSTADPEFAGDFASIPDILAEACADATTAGSWGKRLCDNLDAQVSAVPTALLATTYEGTETFKDFLRFGAAMLFNNYTSSAPNFDFKNISGSKTRIRYSTATGSRTTTLRDATD